jgi:hypothetical protein
MRVTMATFLAPRPKRRMNVNGIALRASLPPLIVVLALAAAASGQNGSKRNRANEQPRRPTVSPYMNLVNNPQGGATNYQSLVRPQLEQQATNRKQGVAIAQLGRQAFSGSPQPKSQGNGQLRSTGHRAVFNDTSRYYPGLRP